MTRKKHAAVKPASPSRDALQDALARYQPLLSAQDFAALLAELDHPLLQALRANPLKVDPAAALSEWSARYGWETLPVPYCQAGRFVEKAETPLSQTPEHRLGFYYMQDAASMLPVELFDFDGLESPLILDLAASPGGKTTHLAARSADRGLIIANDSSQERIQALRLVLQTWGAVNTAVTHFPGERFGAWYPGLFDRVLLDAPCSMQNLRSTDAHPMRPISPRERASLAQRQAALLGSALRALKTGGQVVYSTCTLSPEEDEGVLDAVLQRFGSAVQVDDLSKVLPAPAPGLPADGERIFDPAVRNAARLWPHRFGTSGFFAARLTRLGDLPGPALDAPIRPLAVLGLAPLSPRDQSALVERLSQTYGFNYAAVLEQQQLSLWRRGDVIYAFPELFLTHFNSLPFQALGQMTGEDTPEGYTPSHEWLARFAPRFTTGKVILDPNQAAAWWRGEDVPGDWPLSNGAVAAVFDDLGRLCGRARVSPGRLKNLLPRRLTSA